MGIIEYREGCEGVPKCMGPSDGYYAVFGADPQFLAELFSIALLIGLVTFSVLFLLRKKKKIRLPLWGIIMISLGVTVLTLWTIGPSFRVVY